MTQGPMGIFDGLFGSFPNQMSIPNQQAMGQQQAQNVGWYQQQAQAMNAYQPCIPIDDYTKAMIELDALYPNVNVNWPKYVEPLLLRFLRWIVSKL